LKERAHERWKTAMSQKEFLAADELNTQMSYFAGLTQAQSDAELQSLHIDETGNLRGAGA